MHMHTHWHMLTHTQTHCYTHTTYTSLELYPTIQTSSGPVATLLRPKDFLHLPHLVI